MYRAIEFSPIINYNIAASDSWKPFLEHMELKFLPKVRSVDLSGEKRKDARMINSGVILINQKVVSYIAGEKNNLFLTKLCPASQ